MGDNNALKRFCARENRESTVPSGI
ncbi:uncharacterized protein METZ01_LOCUS191575, partial [marine metagenome]